MITEYSYNESLFVNILLEHQFKSSTPGPENERVMIFYHEARVDGLVKREETQTEMTEEYSNRDDFLFYKYVEFGKRAKKFGPQETSSAYKGRPINVIFTDTVKVVIYAGG